MKSYWLCSNQRHVQVCVRLPLCLYQSLEIPDQTDMWLQNQSVTVFKTVKTDGLNTIWLPKNITSCLMAHTGTQKISWHFIVIYENRICEVSMVTVFEQSKNVHVIKICYNITVLWTIQFSSNPWKPFIKLCCTYKRRWEIVIMYEACKY